MTIPDKVEFTLAIPTAEGFLGRECNAPNCRRFFKVHKDSLHSQMHCPYCGQDFPNDQLWTQGQIRYAGEAVAHEILPQLAQHFSDILRRGFSGPGWTFKAGPPTPPPPTPVPPPERSVDSELSCPHCSTRFQVDGIFGFCPGCGLENLLLYDANLSIIRSEIAVGQNPERALRHAYADLVSTFEMFCRKEAIKRSLPPTNFQNLVAARAAFRDGLHLDILDRLTATQELSLRRVFNKRHVWEHNGGIVDQRYVDQVPEDAAILGLKAPLSVGELETAAEALRLALEALVTSRAPRADGA